MTECEYNETVLAQLDNDCYNFLRDNAPNWAEWMDEFTDFYNPSMELLEDDDITLDISDPKFCIVGEAHGFSEEYYRNSDKQCKECKKYADTIGRYLTVDKEEFEKELSAFSDHYYEVHEN